MSKLLRVKVAFAYMADGVPDVLPEGRIVSADHPAVKGRESHFESVEADAFAPRSVTAALLPASGVIESASAAPGEKRSRGRVKPVAGE